MSIVIFHIIINVFVFKQIIVIMITLSLFKSYNY